MKKSLIDTNPHLKDAKKRDEAMARNVNSSSAIEGIWTKRDASTGRFENCNHKDGAASGKESDERAEKKPNPGTKKSAR